MNSVHYPSSAQPEGASATEATLSITLRHPATGFLYRATSPRLQVDGVDVPVPGWGTHRIPVVPGRRQVQVWVPYVIPRRVGRVRGDVEVPSGAEAELEYMAPTVTFGRGMLGTPGQQKSAGWSAVMVFNVVSLISLLVLLIVAFF